MSEQISRRDALKVLGVAGATALVPQAAAAASSGVLLSSSDPVASVAADILPLTSTSDVFIPPRGNGFMKFSFDFPEPSVAFGGLRFGVMMFTHENAYGLDRERMTAETTTAGLRMTCTGLVWAGGQERSPGRVVLDLRSVNDTVEWDITAECSHPIKSVSTVVRGVPRGKLSGGGDFFDPRDDEVLLGYPFSGGDLFGPGAAGGLTTPLVMVQPTTGWRRRSPPSASSPSSRRGTGVTTGTIPTTG